MSSLSSRIKLSLALELEKQHELTIKFDELLKPDPSKQKMGDGVYANLSKLATTFVTTNYDDWLHQSLPAPLKPVEGASPTQPDKIRTQFYKQSDITVENLDIPNAVFHLHGSVKDRASMVITTTQYLERYVCNQNPICIE